MKALTLWQPWASLVALGVKTIETRSWSTSHRGPLAIHASKHPISEKHVVGDWEAWPPDAPGRIHPNHDHERPARIYCNMSPCTRGLRTVIDEQTSTYGWEFMFMGTSQEAMLQAAAAGFAAQTSYATMDSANGIKSSYVVASSTIARARTQGGKVEVNEEDRRKLR